MTPSISHSTPGRGPVDHDVRDQIVIAAMEHFRLYGYEKTTVSDLAKTIGFSKAYIYKFFESKQAIGEVICGNCLAEIERSVHEAMAGASTASDRLRRLFRALVDSSVRLFFQDRKLYDIAASAAGELWPAARDYEGRIKLIIESIVREGRESGEFERKTPLDETTQAIHLVMRPYTNPLLLQHNFDVMEQAPAQLSSLVLRSLSP